jgi:hypothetical protein
MTHPNRVVKSTRTAFCVAFAMTLAALAGCKGEPYSTKPVSGKVTYEDGSPIPAAIRLTFYSQTPPINEKTKPKKGVAMADANGQFDSATTFNYLDGLIVGEHKVIVQCADKSGPAADKVVPPDCGDPDKTPLKVNTNKLPLEIKVPKPH